MSGKKDLRPAKREINYKDLSNSEGSEENSNSEGESVVFDLKKSLKERESAIPDISDPEQRI